MRRSGSRLVAGSGSEVFLRGIAFASSETDAPSDEDYASVKALGANTVRLALGYRTFYDAGQPDRYKDSAWRFLGAQIALAGRHNIHLVLQLCDVEGAQFVPVSGKHFDYRIWEVPGLQDRFVGIWRAIANRYAREPRIAGYSLFCEPVVSGGVEQWSRLAQRTIREIRNVDRNHLLLVERIYGERGIRREVSGLDLSPDRTFFKVQDEIVAYEFYFFERDEYTHQFAKAVLVRALAGPLGRSAR